MHANILVHREYIGVRHNGKPKYSITYEWKGDESAPVLVSGEFMRRLPHNWMKKLPWKMKITRHDKARDMWEIRRAQ